LENIDYSLNNISIEIKLEKNISFPLNNIVLIKILNNTIFKKIILKIYLKSNKR